MPQILSVRYAWYVHKHQNAEIRRKCRFLRGLYLFFFFFFLFRPIMISAGNVEKGWFFMAYFFFEAPKNKAAHHTYKNAEIRQKCRFLKGLYFFYPIMKSAGNVWKVMFLCHIFFCLKPRRISASYEQGHKNAEIRKKCRFLRDLYFIFRPIMISAENFEKCLFLKRPFKFVCPIIVSAENGEKRRFLEAFYFLVYNDV